MKNQRHKRKESFSVLLISNVDRSSRQFNISLFTLRLMLFVFIFVCAAAAWLTYQFVINHNVQSTLREQITAQDQMVQQLTSEKEAINSEKEDLNNEKLALESENEELRQAAEQKTAEEEAQAEAAEQERMEAELEAAIPSRYPFSGASVLKEQYSEEQDYLAVNTYKESTIIAAGNGTVISIRSDDTYPYIIEVEHANSYLSRYMCRGEAQLNTEEGAQIQAGDVLLTITTDETQVDYQVIYEDAPIDPLSIIDAKG